MESINVLLGQYSFLNDLGWERAIVQSMGNTMPSLNDTLTLKRVSVGLNVKRVKFLESFNIRLGRVD